MLISMEQSTIKVVFFYVPFGMKTHYFEKLLDLIVTEQNICWFIMQLCIVKQFNQHYNGYKVELGRDHFLCQQDLANHLI